MTKEVNIYDFDASLQQSDQGKEIQNLVNEWKSQGSVSFQTSGSTGTPKRINFSKEQVARSAELTAEAFDLPAGSNALLCLPLVYVAGKMMVLRSIVNDWKLYYATPSKNPLVALNHSVDFCALTPLQVQEILNSSPEKLGLIKTILVGGGPIDENLALQLIARGLNVYHSYGMTETLTHVALKKVEGNRDIYQALQTVKFDVTSDNALKILAPHISSSWIITNDRVELLNEIEFRWLGRIDNVINSGGVKLSPEIIEAKLRKDIKADYFIQGFQHDDYGTAIELVIDESAQEFIDEIRQLIEDKLEKYEQPKRIVIAKIEKTESGKIKRNSIEIIEILKVK